MNLSDAVASGKVKAVQRLRPTKAQLNAIDPDNGESLLEVAAERGDVAMVELLLDLGASPDLPVAALPIAASRRDHAMVELLLSHGADIEAQDELGNTALICAAQAGDEEIVRLLLERGADPKVRNRGGASALYAAAEANEWEMVPLLESKSSPSERRRVRAAKEQRQAETRTPEEESRVRALVDAAKTGQRDVVERLLDSGVPIDAATKGGRPALSLAANRGHVRVVELLLSRGADVNRFDEYDETPLSYAARASTPACFDLLWPLSSPASRKVGLKRAEDFRSRNPGWQYWVPPPLKKK